MKISAQSSSSIVMIRPHHFTVNAETAIDNAFQVRKMPQEELGNLAYQEISKSAEILSNHGIKVHMFENKNSRIPDSVFPNNWLSTHPGGHVAVYPMKALSRRLERRWDILEMLKSKYQVNDIIDYSGLEYDNLFLEGTGSMVLDHLNRIAYAIESDRTNLTVLERFCKDFNYEPMTFSAEDENGVTVYHTNILMCIGTEIALIGLDMITNESRRQEILDRLKHSGRKVIALSNTQIIRFAGNAIELQGRDKSILALSNNAYGSLTNEQISIISDSAILVPLEIPTIELSGGSVRCTIADIHLSPRNDPTAKHE
ncbi:MAG TPA: amidinotransferase [Sulfurimonas sp.]|nr:amidinotransferase [Sulfurimonas sp.]